jgi:hypothetical protein
MAKHRRGWIIAVVVVSLVVLTVVIAASLAGEPLRRYAEERANSALSGFHVTIGVLELHPVTLSAELRDVVVRQDIHPEPPVVSIPQLIADARLAALFSGTVGADVRVETPAFTLTKKQLDGLFRRHGAEEGEDRAQPWQDLLRAAVGFRGAFYLKNGHLTYDEGKQNSELLRIERIDVEVQDITNRSEPQQEYPSKLRAAMLFPSDSHVAVDGRADLLAIPLPRVKADFRVDRLQLKDLLPVVARYNVQCTAGSLDLQGYLEYSKDSTVVAVDQLRLQDAKIDYVHSAATKPKEVQRAKKAAQKVKEAPNDPTTRVTIEHGKVLNSELGFVNKATDPAYRVFIAGLDMDLEHLSNRLDEGTGVVKLTGKFMGSGRTELHGAFRPEKPRPDFDLNVKIVKTDVEAFNNVLRAYGDVDTHRGVFAFFSELAVKDNAIHGYVKPLLKDVEVYDPEQDKDKPMTKKIYEAVVGGVLELFENKSRNEAATVTDLSGPVENPHANTWQVVQKLVQNAFFKAILPGFERVR